jgi:hypothetical protein
MGLLDAPGISRAAFEAAALTLLQGNFTSVRLNGHSAAAGVGGTGGVAGSGGGRLAYPMLRTKLYGNPLGGAVLSIDGVEMDLAGSGAVNVNTGVGGYARALKDYGQPGQSTLSAAVTAAATSFAVAATNFPFGVTFTPPTLYGVAHATPANPFRIRVEDEEMIVTAVDAGGYTASRTFTVTRGVNGTVAAAHPAGAPVFHVLGVKGASGVAGQQSQRPYLPWPVFGPQASVGQVLPFFWWDLNDFFFHCTNAFGTLTGLPGSVANYDAARRAYISAYRRVISRARAASVLEDEAISASTAIGSLAVAQAGFFNSSNVAGGSWLSAVNIDANYIRRCSGNRYTATNAAGDFVEYNGPTDLSQDQAIVFGGIAAAGDNCVITFTVDGTTVGTLNTSQVCSPTANYATGWAFRITEALMQANGMSLKQTGHRYRATLTTRTAGYFRLDSIDVESGHGSPVLVAGGFRPLDTSNSGISAGGNGPFLSLSDRNTKIAQIIADVDALRAEFAPYSGLPNSVLKVDVDGVLGVDAAKRNADGLHPNDAGYGGVATSAFSVLISFALATRNATALLSA